MWFILGVMEQLIPYTEDVLFHLKKLGIGIFPHYPSKS